MKLFNLSQLKSNSRVLVVRIFKTFDSWICYPNQLVYQIDNFALHKRY